MRILVLVTFAFLFSAPAANSQESIKWKAGPPAFKVKEGLEKFAPVVKIEGDKILIRNRGLLVSEKQHKAGATLEFTSKWTQGKDEGFYQDVMTVVFKTTGEQRAKWSHEISDGIAVRFAAHGKTVSVEHFKVGEQSPVLLARAQFVSERGKEQTIKISEDQSVISIHVDEKEVLFCKIPILDGPAYIALYNREPVAAVEQEWQVTFKKK